MCWAEGLHRSVDFYSACAKLTIPELPNTLRSHQQLGEDSRMPEGQQRQELDAAEDVVVYHDLVVSVRELTFSRQFLQGRLIPQIGGKVDVWFQDGATKFEAWVILIDTEDSSMPMTYGDVVLERRSTFATLRVALPNEAIEQIIREMLQAEVTLDIALNGPTYQKSGRASVMLPEGKPEDGTKDGVITCWPFPASRITYHNSRRATDRERIAELAERLSFMLRDLGPLASSSAQSLTLQRACVERLSDLTHLVSDLTHPESDASTSMNQINPIIRVLQIDVSNGFVMLFYSCVVLCICAILITLKMFEVHFSF